MGELIASSRSASKRDTRIPNGRWLPLSGVVIGALLNDPAELAALGEAAQRPPHGALPKAPVLEIKPRHTLASEGALVMLPEGHDDLEVGVSLGLVLADVACQLRPEQAWQAIAGFRVAADFSLPVTSHYRPAVRLKARDGYCPISALIPREARSSLIDSWHGTLTVDGERVQHGGWSPLVRDAAQLLADISAFMTLMPGDTVLLGRCFPLAKARAGQRVMAHVDGLGSVSCLVVKETSPQAGEEATA